MRRLVTVCCLSGCSLVFVKSVHRIVHEVHHIEERFLQRSPTGGEIRKTRRPSSDASSQIPSFILGRDSGVGVRLFRTKVRRNSCPFVSAPQAPLARYNQRNSVTPVVTLITSLTDELDATEKDHDSNKGSLQSSVGTQKVIFLVRRREASW